MAEKELEFCEEYQFHGVDVYHLIVDMAEEGIWILDQRDTIVFANNKMLSMLGYSKKELLCRSVFDVIADRDIDTVKKALERRHKGLRETYRARLMRKDGSCVWVAMAAAPIMDKQGKYQGAVTMALDITQVKQSEEALEKEKSQANMYLDLMAHDINNLNQVSIGYLEIALDFLQHEPACAGSGELENYLRKSLNSLCNCTELINNVKTLRRLRMEHLRQEDVDLGNIIAEAVRDYPKVPGRDVSIEFKKPEQCYVRANPLLKEVFTNMIGNSVKHSQGAVMVWITVDSTIEKGKKFYEVTVADNGPGIHDEKKLNLFRRFKGAGAKAGGHGLGLYLVRTIVEDFGGRVRVEDRVPGDYSKGAKFVVLLPAA
jgi:PAS domain S-box-containing protein